MSVRLSCLRYAIGGGQLRDVSVSGAFVETKLRVALLACVYVEIDFPSQHRSKRHSLPGHVMRHDENGIGIEWVELAPAAVIKFLEARAPIIADRDAQNEQIPNRWLACIK